MTFAERLKQARRGAGITSQAKLAELSGLTLYAIRQLEAGKRNPSSGETLKLADACGVMPEYFTREIEVEIHNGTFYSWDDKRHGLKHYKPNPFLEAARRCLKRHRDVYKALAESDEE